MISLRKFVRFSVCFSYVRCIPVGSEQFGLGVFCRLSRGGSMSSEDQLFVIGKSVELSRRNNKTGVVGKGFG